MGSIQDDPGIGLVENIRVFSNLTLIVRKPDGSIRHVRQARNMKVYNTFNIMASILHNSPGDFSALTVNKFALGSGPSVASGDTTLSGEVATASRTIGRFSHDANAANWNLSWSMTAWTASTSVKTAAFFTSLTGGLMFLKTSFTDMTIMSQDTLNAAWLQSMASA